MEMHNKLEIELDRNGFEYVIVKNPKTGKEEIFYVHNLIYENFVGQIPFDKQVTHKDGNIRNNAVDNLILKPKLNFI